ncbi:MAG: DUF554 domain-containing protein [candidate division KSB1 bacterium]|nr:DUF554 domain-containing protein [candidate division KSB1 bacterium]
MTGTWVNAAAVIIGSTLGLLIHRRLPERFTRIVFQAIGLFTIFLGVSMALKTGHELLLILSLVTGGLLGEAVHLEERLNSLSDVLARHLKTENQRFTEGLITAFLLFCIGSLTLLGAIEEGLGNPPRLLLTKSMLDFFSSIALTTAFGIGVMFSVIPLILFQGGITLLAALFGEFLSQTLISELTAVGGLMILALGINLLESETHQGKQLFAGSDYDGHFASFVSPLNARMRWAAPSHDRPNA